MTLLNFSSNFSARPSRHVRHRGMGVGPSPVWHAVLGKLLSWQISPAAIMFHHNMMPSQPASLLRSATTLFEVVHTARTITCWSARVLAEMQICLLTLPLCVWSEGVHSRYDQLKQFVEGAAKQGAKRIRVHILTDGRDVPDGSRCPTPNLSPSPFTHVHIPMPPAACLWCCRQRSLKSEQPVDALGRS